MALFRMLPRCSFRRMRRFLIAVVMLVAAAAAAAPAAAPDQAVVEPPLALWSGTIDFRATQTGPGWSSGSVSTLDYRATFRVSRTGAASVDVAASLTEIASRDPSLGTRACSGSLTAAGWTGSGAATDGSFKDSGPAFPAGVNGGVGITGSWRSRTERAWSMSVRLPDAVGQCEEQWPSYRFTRPWRDSAPPVQFSPSDLPYPDANTSLTGHILLGISKAAARVPRVTGEKTETWERPDYLRGGTITETLTARWDIQPECEFVGFLSGRFMLPITRWVDVWPPSTDIADLASPFRENVARFIRTLKAAGAEVVVNTTSRPRERAWLMHHAFRIWRGSDAYPKEDAAAVPDYPHGDGFADVPICWVHRGANGEPSKELSEQTAGQMVADYGIVEYGAARRSAHTTGNAIDMTITWKRRVLKIRDRCGNKVVVGGWRDGARNRQLHRVGETFGVHKLAGDDPHWANAIGKKAGIQPCGRRG